MRNGKRWLAALVALWFLSASPLWAANTWRVVRPLDCTGLGTGTVGGFSGSVPCCVAAGSAANTDTCNVRMALGHFFAVNATFIVSAAGTYTPGATEANTTGDSISGAEFQKLGLGTVLFDICEAGDTTATPGRQVNLVRQKATSTSAPGTQLAFKFYNLSSAAGAAPTELTAATSLTVGETVQCLLFGR